MQSNFIKTTRCEHDADSEEDFLLPLRKKRRRPLFANRNKPDNHKQSLSQVISCSDPFDKTTEIDSSSSAACDPETVIDDPHSVQEHQQNERDNYYRDTKFLISDVIQKQHSDPELKALLNYIESETLPESQKLAREILLKHSDYALISGMLFHSRHAKSNRSKTHHKYQLVVPRSMVQDILYMQHDSPLAAHGGIQDTLDRIKEHYYFQRMSSIVSDYVKSCQHCQMRKNSRMPTKSGITSYPTPAAPFEV